MSYESTLRWYANNQPSAHEKIITLIQAQMPTSSPTPTLAGKHVCLVIGHEPGGGTKGERKWNIKVATLLAPKLEALGATVFIYTHRTASYTSRCNEMRTGVKKHMPDADCVILMHYNAFDKKSANGHEFHYYGTPALAKCFRDSWQAAYPWSRPRQVNGILHNPNGRGSQMLQKAPAAAVLLEPFFRSSPKESNILLDDHENVATSYSNAISNFLLL
jgi:N-acetylmuramoyl-L-alanine amidase